MEMLISQTFKYSLTTSYVPVTETNNTAIVISARKESRCQKSLYPKGVCPRWSGQRQFSWGSIWSKMQRMSKSKLDQREEGRAHLAGRRSRAKALSRRENGDKGLEKSQCNWNREPGEASVRSGWRNEDATGPYRSSSHLPQNAREQSQCK